MPPPPLAEHLSLQVADFGICHVQLPCQARALRGRLSRSLLTLLLPLLRDDEVELKLPERRVLLPRLALHMPQRIVQVLQLGCAVCNLLLRPRQPLLAVLTHPHLLPQRRRDPLRTIACRLLRRQG